MLKALYYNYESVTALYVTLYYVVDPNVPNNALTSTRRTVIMSFMSIVRYVETLQALVWVNTKLRGTKSRQIS